MKEVKKEQFEQTGEYQWTKPLSLLKYRVIQGTRYYDSTIDVNCYNIDLGRFTAGSIGKLVSECYPSWDDFFSNCVGKRAQCERVAQLVAEEDWEDVVPVASTTIDLREASNLSGDEMLSLIFKKLGISKK